MAFINNNAIFKANAINCLSNRILGSSIFLDTSINKASVNISTFSNSAINSGNAECAIFMDNAVNLGTITSGVFLGASINSGIVKVAEFFQSACNAGTVTSSAIFAETSISNGTINGSVKIAETAIQGENQILTEAPTQYFQLDGFYPNGYYENGIKSPPLNYQTLVCKIDNFWYQYDSLGNAKFASGEYDDGTALTLPFAYGIKGKVPPSAITLEGGVYYYTGIFTDGTVLYTNQILIATVNNFYLANAGDLNNDGYNDYVSTDQNGYATITYGSNTPPPDGTFIRTETLYITIYDIEYVNGSKDIVANGTGGERDGNYNYPENGSLFSTVHHYVFFSQGVYSDGTVDNLANGSGGYFQDENLVPNDTKIAQEVNTITIGSNSYNNGTVDILSDGSGGAKFGTINSSPEGSEFTNDGTYRYLSDGFGGYYTEPV